MAMPNLAWGGFKNGQIPRGNLVDIGSGKLLQADAAYNWGRFTAAFRARWRDDLYLDGYQDAYRDWNRQNEMYQRYLATGLPKNGVAKPGNSIHGWARSVDCTGYGTGSTTQRHVWMQQNGPSYGWSWSYGRELKEPWHWDYVGAITTTAGDGGITPFPPPIIYTQEEEEMLYSAQSNGPAGSGIMSGYLYIQGADGVLRPVGQKESLAQTSRPGVFIAQYSGADLTAIAQSYGIMQVTWAGLEPMFSGTILRGNPLAPVAAAAGSFTTADRAMLDDIASKGELGQALTSTVVLVNNHADTNRDQILEAIDEIPSGGSSPAGSYSLSLAIDGVPGTATGTATPTA